MTLWSLSESIFSRQSYFATVEETGSHCETVYVPSIVYHCSISEIATILSYYHRQTRIE